MSKNKEILVYTINYDTVSMAVDECEEDNFGGFRRRTWRYHGLCPWGSI
jgi:hypothetical protein